MPSFSAEMLRLAEEWEVRLIESLPGASCSEVAGGLLADGREVVLKLPDREAEESSSDSVARIFAQYGGVPIYRSDPGRGALLMPRLRPGRSLDQAGATEDEATEVFCRLVLRLRQAPIHACPWKLETWIDDVHDLPSSELADFARLVGEDLFRSSPSAGLLHGDLHHFNILEDNGTWIVIDPKGVLGDPSFEVAAFLRNPAPNVISQEVCRRRLELCAELLGDPIERLWGWSFVQTTLCAQATDDPDVRRSWFETAESLYELRSRFSTI